VTSRTFPGCWGIEILARFHNLIVTTSAVAMERLLVGQGHQFSSDFKLICGISGKSFGLVSARA
jgi:hypothetical protein